MNTLAYVHCRHRQGHALREKNKVVLNKKGKEVDAGVAETEMPADIHNLNKIEKIYLSKLAEDLCAFVPDPVLEKNTVKKEAEDSKKAKSQRKVIQGLISE